METVEKINALKRSGDELFVAGKYDEAYEQYTAAVDLGRDLKVYTPSERSKLLSIRAESLIRQEKFKEAITDCEAALEEDEKNLKARFRRAKCLEAMSLLSKAAAELKIVMRSDPENKQAIDLMRKVQRRMGVTGAAVGPVVAGKGGKRGTLEEEPETHVTWEAQKQICEYNRLNKVKVEIEDEIAQINKSIDASGEGKEALEMVLDEETSRLTVGDCFFAVKSSEEIEAYIDEKITEKRNKVKALKGDLTDCIATLTPLHAELKKTFGEHIGLPDIKSSSKHAGK
jgi:tetratricopeptide (TPR) repeat protein